MSKQIQSLELGGKLLVRVPGGVRPTGAGARLDDMARSLLGSVEDIRQSVRQAASELVGTVTVGISPSLVPVVAGYLTAAVAEHPELTIRIVEALPMFLSEWLDLGRLDVGLFTQWPPEDDGARLEFETIDSDEVLLTARAGLLPTNLGACVTAAQLRPLSLALTRASAKSSRTGWGWTRPRSSSGSRSTPHMVKDLVLGGKYCSALPYTFVRGELRSGHLVAVSFDPPVRRRPVGATRPGRRKHAPIDAVVRAVQNRLAEITVREQPHDVGR